MLDIGLIQEVVPHKLHSCACAAESPILKVCYVLFQLLI